MFEMSQLRPSEFVRVREGPRTLRDRARFFQKLIFYMVSRPKLMFFMQNFKGFPMPQLLFKLCAGAQGFFPAKRAFCPFCHMYARALFPKINILQAAQAKITYFV